MKKTLTVNLNGRVFTIDEDAYQLLDNYLRNLRIYFRKEKGSSEIIADFEARIEELFSERIRLGYEVITIDQVESVIERMGNPSDFGMDSSEESVEEPILDREFQTKRVKKKLYRNIDDKMFSGICSGLAAYFGWDTLAVRIIFIVLLFATSFWIVPVYLIAWLIIPAAYTAEQKLQMRGEEITIGNIGKTVAAETNTNNISENKGCLGTFVDFIVAFLKICLIALACIIGIPLIFALAIVVIVLFAVLFGVGGGLLSVLPFSFLSDISLVSVSHPLVATISFILLLGIPLVALIYIVISYFAKLKPVHKGVKWASIAVWIIALVAFLCSGFKFNWFDFSRNINSIRWGNSHINYNVLEGNGIPSNRIETLPAVYYVKVDENLVANLQIEQIDADTSKLMINGDSNIIDKVKCYEENGHLRLYVLDDYRFRTLNPLDIRLQIPSLKGLELNSINNINLLGKIKTDELTVKMEGAGKFEADSLYAIKLNIKTEGIGSIILRGEARNAIFALEGAGNINASELKSDSVYATVDGIGSIKCNAIQFLDGNVRGIGSISYKEEPAIKNTSFNGIGRIGKE